MQRLIPFVIAIGVAFTSATAQAPLAVRDVNAEESGNCPRADLERLPGLGPDRLVKGLGFTYVLKPPAIRRTVNRSSDALPDAIQPKPFQPVVIYGRDVQTKSLLVGFNQQKNCGWVDPDVLLYDADKPTTAYGKGPMPILVKDGPDGLNNPDNDLDLKVVLQNLQRDGQDGAPILSAPGASTKAPDLNRLKLFYVFEVFRVEKVADPDKGGQPRFYYLIGRTPGDRGDDGRLDGWVHEDDVYTWTTRVAAFWNGTGEARGYFEKELLGSGQFAIKEPDKDKLKEPENRTIQRFPVMSQEPSTAEIVARRRNEPASPQAIDALIKNYRIATPSCAQVSTGPGVAVTPSTANKDCYGTGDVGDRIANLRNIDVMFLIDATTSMDAYFPATRRALEKFIGGLTQGQEDGVTIRAAVHIYGDYTGDVADLRAINYTPLIPFLELPRLKIEFVRFDGLTMFSDKHNDKPEASFAALLRAAKSPSWSPNAAIRYLVHIGDHGSREVGKTSGTGTSTLVERYTAEDVATALKEQGIIYVGIPVEGGRYEAFHNEAFVRQAKRIAELNPRLAAPVRPTYEAGRRQETEEARVGVIATALQEGVKLSKEARKDIVASIECAQNPNNPKCVEGRPKGSNEGEGWMAQVIAGLRERHGLTQDQINRIYGRSQTVGSFYFRPLTVDGKRQLFKYYIAIEVEPLRRLNRVVLELCQNIDTNFGMRYLNRVLTETLETTVDSHNDSVADIMSRRLFIPAFHFNPLLLKPFSEMEIEHNHMLGTEQINVLKRHFCKSSRLLGWALDGRRIRSYGEIVKDQQQNVWKSGHMVWNEAEKAWKAGRDADLIEYSWTHGGGDGSTSVPLFYIPVDFLPN